MSIVPEVYCSDIQISRGFYTNILLMNIKYERPEEGFIYFEKDGGELMVEMLSDKGRHWITCKLEKPFGRGINLQWSVNDLDSLYQKVQECSPDSIYLGLECKEYLCGEKVKVQRQFIVQDPDGYLIRFCD